MQSQQERPTLVHMLSKPKLPLCQMLGPDRLNHDTATSVDLAMILTAPSAAAAAAGNSEQIANESVCHLILGFLLGSQRACPHPQPLRVGFHLEPQQTQTAHANDQQAHCQHSVRLLTVVHPLHHCCNSCACLNCHLLNNHACPTPARLAALAMHAI